MAQGRLVRIRRSRKGGGGGDAALHDGVELHGCVRISRARREVLGSVRCQDHSRFRAPQ